MYQLSRPNTLAQHALPENKSETTRVNELNETPSQMHSLNMQSKAKRQLQFDYPETKVYLYVSVSFVSNACAIGVGDILSKEVTKLV